jgi:hypothetical protein
MSLCGHKVCEQDFSEKYQVETVDFVAYLREVAEPHDVIVLRMDIEGAEYQVPHSVVFIILLIIIHNGGAEYYFYYYSLYCPQFL